MTKKPYALVGEAIISGALFAEVACRNTAGGGGKDELELPLKNRLRAYVVPVLTGTVVFTGLSVGQDYFIYGQKDAVSPKRLKEYYYLALASVMFEGMFAVGHSVKIDKVMIKSLPGLEGFPKLRSFVTSWIESPAVQSNLGRILKNDKSLVDLEKKLMTSITEGTLRVGYFSGKMASWTYFSQFIIPKLEESPLFNFIFDGKPDAEPPGSADS